MTKRVLEKGTRVKLSEAGVSWVVLGKFPNTEQRKKIRGVVSTNSMFGDSVFVLWDGYKSSMRMHPEHVIQA